MNRQMIEDAATRHLSPEHANLYISLLRETATFVPSADRALRSHLGGQPVVALDEWPTWQGNPLNFLACIDLAEVAGIETGLVLPLAGSLSIFYAADADPQPWGEYPDQRDSWRVVYSGADEGRQLSAPDGTTVFHEIPLTAESSTDAPGYEEPAVQEILNDQKDEFLALYEEVHGPGWETDGKHQIGGWPFLQQAAIWIDAQPWLQHESAHSVKDDEVSLYGQGDLELLLQLDSDDAAGWMWADGGILYFTIHKQDLADMKFDRCWLTSQCG